MKRELIIFLCLAGFLYNGAANAENRSDWGILLQNVATAANASTKQNTDDLTKLKDEYKAWNKKVSASESSVQNSFNKLVSNISPKSEAAKINNKINAINNANNLSAADKSAMAAQIIYDYSVNLQNNKTNLTKLLNSATTEKRNEIVASLKELNNATNNYTGSLGQGTNIVKKIAANPKLGLNMASEYTDLSKRLKTANTTINALNNIASSVNILLGK